MVKYWKIHGELSFSFISDLKTSIQTGTLERQEVAKDCMKVRNGESIVPYPYSAQLWKNMFSEMFTHKN